MSPYEDAVRSLAKSVALLNLAFSISGMTPEMLRAAMTTIKNRIDFVLSVEQPQENILIKFDGALGEFEDLFVAAEFNDAELDAFLRDNTD